MTTYRRKKGTTDVWHWCKNCSNYPKADYDEEWHSGRERPKTGELDNECRSKEEQGKCET